MRKWIETIPPKMMHDELGIYKGEWFPKMDRCWNSDDGVYQVCSRLIITKTGLKIEHATINVIDKENYYFSSNGERDIPWKEKQAIKNEIFGEDRIAIEVFPEESHLVDVMDIYHLWVLPKYFKMPFGIHPVKDEKCRIVNRGINKNLVLDNTKKIYLGEKNEELRRN